MTLDRAIPIPGGRTLFATQVFDTYWRFACARQNVFMRRATGELPPWTDDHIIAAHRFTNVYRASDRVSQYLIRHVQYSDRDATPEDLFFRTVLFKLFNRVSTWESFVAEFGEAPSWGAKDTIMRLDSVLTAAFERGEQVYSAAYIMPSPPFGATRKHTNHLLLLAHMMKDGAAKRAAAAGSLGGLYRLLRGYPSLGNFLAFQLAIDVNYSTVTDYRESEFVVAGPGARSGISKCFSGVGGLSEADVIRAVSDIAESELERLGLRFQNLWGRAPQLIDYQNLFCEVDKYSRVAHPEFAGSGRTKIKQKYMASLRPIPQWYPPKWGIVLPVGVQQ